MKNLLAGNGVTIQFGGTDYLNASIINRAIANIKSGKFPPHLYPAECAAMLDAMQQELSKVVSGKYDTAAATAYIRASLTDFKQRYSDRHVYEVHEIGFEDYFLIFELVHICLLYTSPSPRD